MAIINTGIVLRTITGVHDANFVHPIGDELISNGDFSNGANDWTFSSGATLTDIGAKITHTPTAGSIGQSNTLVIGKQYKLTYEITESISGGLKFNSAVNSAMVTTVGVHTKYFEADNTTAIFSRTDASNNDVTITNISVKEMLVNRESTATNTGIVERSIVGVHDANFVRPLGDEEVLNGDFSNGSTDWTLGTGWSVSDGKATANGAASLGRSIQQSAMVVGKNYKLTFDVTDYTSGDVRILVLGPQTVINSNGSYTVYGTATSNLIRFYSNSFDGSITNASVKEMLVNRESTTTNTGIVERAITGSNESELWLDESTSVVNNTGIVERPITGVNESDPMFPDNTISNIRNINDTTLYEELLEALQLRAAYYENEEGTTEILTNLFNC